VLGLSDWNIGCAAILRAIVMLLSICGAYPTHRSGGKLALLCRRLRGGFNYLPREAGDVACPISKTRPEPMNGDALELHAPQNHLHCHVGERLIVGSPGDDDSPVLSL
jgi:hypothetical protein